MKRVLVASVFTVALLAGSGTGAALAAQPTPAPPTPVAPTSTADVCDRSRTTMLDGIRAFTGEMDKAGVAATSGDAGAADASVKQSGTLLVELGGKVRKDAEKAANAELKKALEDVATQLEKLGTNLTAVSAIQSFDTRELETASNRVAEICQR